MTRRYSEKQVADILGRAAELSAKEGPATGASLDDLERIAIEAGLDPVAVRRAAAEVDRGGPAATKVNPLLGAPTSVVFETLISGEVTDDVFERVAELLRVRFPSGQASVVGRTFTWQMERLLPGGQRSSERINVTITSRDGATAVLVEESFGRLAQRTISSGIALTAAALMIGVSGGIVAGPLLVGGLAAVGVLGAFGAGRAVFGIKARARETALQALFNELCQAIDTVPVTTAAKATATAAPTAVATASTKTAATMAVPAPATAEGLAAAAQLEQLEKSRAHSLTTTPPTNAEQASEAAVEVPLPAARR
ncbi:MAG: hypothetical protein A2138_03760 [Deltaproteobacteria bacterium RBG_16_71_12]|nr:MAG: hypothetical protein A2138_03760 [Deltaproteobacteria bacterium RBG_16_71_12]